MMRANPDLSVADHFEIVITRHHVFIRNRHRAQLFAVARIADRPVFELHVGDAAVFAFVRFHLQRAGERLVRDLVRQRVGLRAVIIGHDHFAAVDHVVVREHQVAVLDRDVDFFAIRRILRRDLARAVGRMGPTRDVAQGLVAFDAVADFHLDAVADDNRLVRLAGEDEHAVTPADDRADTDSPPARSECHASTPG